MRYKPIALLAVFLAISSITFSQILPEPGSMLNYTQVMFEHPSTPGTSEYIIQIATDNAAVDFEHPLVTKSDSASATIVSELMPAQKYSWRHTAVINDKNQAWRGPYSFEIIYDSLTDSRFFRVQVEENDSLLNAGGLICLDQANCIVDRSGRVVWFARNGIINKPMGFIRDLRVTKFGTITGLFYRTKVVYGSAAEPREYTLKLDPLWTAPLFIAIEGDTISSYHHSFERTAYNSYLTMGTKLPYCPFPGTDTVAFNRYSHVIAINAKKPDQQEQDVVTEFNKKGELIWNWDPHKYFKPEDLIPTLPDKNLTDLKKYGPHMNATFEDTRNGFVYVGFRDASRIVKVDKQSGKVVNSWGMKLPSGEAFEANGFFTNQHDIKILRNGSMAVFNNNTMVEKDSASGVVVFTPGDSTGHSVINLKYECHFQTEGGMNKSTSGGGVDELENGNLLVSMGITNRTFEITRDKKIVWNAVVERRANVNSAWRHFPLYRSHYTSSLYPCYFTTQTNTSFVSRKSPDFTIKIFNVGTEPDLYNIKIRSSSGGFQKEITSREISASKSQNFEIEAGNTLRVTDKIEVVVTSITNPDLVRTVKLDVVN